MIVLHELSRKPQAFELIGAKRFAKEPSGICEDIGHYNNDRVQVP
jgi:hypothetical protein